MTIGNWLKKHVEEWKLSLLLTAILLYICHLIAYDLTWFDLFESYSFSIEYAGFGFLFLALIAAMIWIRWAFKRVVHRFSPRKPSAKFSKTMDAFFCAVILASAVYHLYRSIALYAPWLYTLYFSYETFYYSTPTILSLIGVFCLSLILAIMHARNRDVASYLWRTAVLFAFVPTFCGILFAINKSDVTSYLEWFNFATRILITIELIVSALYCTIKEQTNDFLTLGFHLKPRTKPKKIPKVTKTKPLKSIQETSKKNTSLKTLWSVRFAVSLLPWCILGGFLLLMLSTCVYTVAPHQQALLFHFGAFDDSSLIESGLHFKLPVPFETVEIFDVDRVQSVTVGYEERVDTDDYLWNTDHAGEEYTLLTGNGNELLAVNMRLNYRISDLMSYYQNYENAAELLASQAYAELMTRTNTSDMTTILMVDRTELSTSVCAELNEFCDQYALGLEVIEVIVESIHPAVEVAYVYQSVVNATIWQTEAMYEAEAYQISEINKALEQKEILINEATARSYESIAQASKELSIFLSAVEAYQQNPDAYLLRKRLTTYETLIANTKLYVFSEGTASYMSRFVMQNGSDTVIIN